MANESDIFLISEIVNSNQKWLFLMSIFTRVQITRTLIRMASLLLKFYLPLYYSKAIKPEFWRLVTFFLIFYSRKVKVSREFLSMTFAY